MEWRDQKGRGEKLRRVLKVGPSFLATPCKCAEFLVAPFEIQINAHLLDWFELHFRRTRCLRGRSTTSSIFCGGRLGNKLSNSASASRTKAIFTRLSSEIFPLSSNNLSDPYETFDLAASSRWVSPCWILRRFILSDKPRMTSTGDDMLNANIITPNREYGALVLIRSHLRFFASK